jgi:hypothetical protein
LCIFHDKDYLLQDKTNYEEHKKQIIERLKHKVNHSTSNIEPLLCIGFQLPEFSLSDLDIDKVFTIPVYFSYSQFYEQADFSRAISKELISKQQRSMELNSKEKQTLIVLDSTAKHTSQGTSIVNQISIMYYLRKKRKLSLTQKISLTFLS